MKTPFDNLGIKIFSLILAIILWIFVTSQERSEVGFSLPLQFKNIPESLEILRSSAEYLNVRISGPGAIVKGITPQQVQVTIDLKNAKEGQTYYQISQSDIPLPKGVELSRISPKDITVEMEKTLRKKVVITPVFLGKLPIDLKLDKAELSTKYVEISGPRSLIDLVNQIETTPIDLSSIVKDTEKEIALRPLAEPIRLIQKGPIYLTIQIKPNIIAKTFEEIPVNGPKGVKLRPEKVSVTIEGVPSKISNLAPGEIKLNLEVSAELKGSVVHLKPKVSLPPDINLVKLQPESISVEYFPGEK